jgi:hypothetical protein
LQHLRLESRTRTSCSIELLMRADRHLVL